jgi:hypothetical protein
MPIDLRPPIERDVPREALERGQSELLSAIASEASRRRSRGATRMTVYAFASLVALVLAALASSQTLRRAIGVLDAPSRSPATIVHEMRSDWEQSLARAALQSPAVGFTNPSRSELRARLAELSSTYMFQVRELTILHPKQDAPAVVVRSQKPAELIRSLPSILRVLDPKGPGDDNVGWAYEGFWFEVVDANGQPVAVIDNAWRPPNGGGSQWTAPGYQYPFDHG